MDDIFARLAKSKFRSSFHLKARDIAYIDRIGMEKVRSHAYDFVRTRLAPAEPANDGKQTPMRGHPIFIAQHACACCCRGCLEKWHKIPRGRALSEDEIEYVVGILMKWVEGEYLATKRNNREQQE